MEHACIGRRVWRTGLSLFNDFGHSRPLTLAYPGTAPQIRREKFAFFEKHCSEVAERIFLSGDAVARSETLLKESGITHVLNAVGAR